MKSSWDWSHAECMNSDHRKENINSPSPALTILSLATCTWVCVNSIVTWLPSLPTTQPLLRSVVLWPSCWKALYSCVLQLENLGNFIKAILAYGLKPTDIFEANDLFENGNMTQVQTTLLALASMVSFTLPWGVREDVLCPTSCVCAFLKMESCRPSCHFSGRNSIWLFQPNGMNFHRFDIRLQV